MKENRLRLGAYITVLALGGGVLAYLFFKHALSAVLPFLIAWAIAFATRRAAAAISKRTRISKRVIRAVLAALVSVAFIGAVCLIGWLLVSELWRLLSGLGDGKALRDIVDGITSLGPLGELFDSFGDKLANIFYEILVSVASSLGGAVTSLLGAVPRVVLFVLVTVIASVYFALDLDRINSAVKAALPKKVIGWLCKFRYSVFDVGVKYLRSYLLLMLLTFGIMIVGLTVLARPYALLLSFVISILDVLPVLGVGTVLIPWGIYEVALGDSRIGIGLFILLAVYTLVRQLAEPKILGKQLGVHPVLTLCLVYVSYTVFGIAGILLVPLLVVILNAAFSKNDPTEVDKCADAEHNGA